MIADGRFLRRVKRAFAKAAVPTLAAIALCLNFGSLAHAQLSTLKYLHDSNMPPGVVGQQQLLRAPGMAGYFQAVEILAPEGVQVSLMLDGKFDKSRPVPLLVGMQIGYVYPLKVTNIPLREGLEVYPTVELVNRLYPPEGARLRFPVPIELTREEIELALGGQYVTRVVYLEDPDTALPQLDDPQHQRVIEVGPREDPLHVADRYGRPLAIVRMGSRVPEEGETAGAGCIGSPPIQLYPAPAKKASAGKQPQGGSQAIERYGKDEPRVPDAALPAPATKPPASPNQP